MPDVSPTNCEQTGCKRKPRLAITFANDTPDHVEAGYCLEHAVVAINAGYPIKWARHLTTAGRPVAA